MHKYFCYALLYSVIAALFIEAPRVSAGQGAKLVVIVAKESPVADLSRAELKRVYLSDKLIVAGQKLVPFNFTAGTAERSAFDRTVLGMSPEVMQRFWVDRKIRGQADAPRSLPSSAIMIKVVAKFPGALAYIPAQDLTPDVKPLRIDGVEYTSPAYTIAK